jgi:hypothetical protein
MSSAPNTKKEKNCGPHTELIANEHTRVTRCACGTVHVHVLSKGLSLQIQDEEFRFLVNSFSAAQRVIDYTESDVSEIRESNDGVLN